MRIAGYEFTDGARFQKGARQNPEAVGQHLELLRKKYKGELTPQDVIDDARNNNSPLHSFFEWTDSKAAEQYRLQQARGLIRSVVAIYVNDEKPAVKQRAFVHIPEAGTPHYRETSHAMTLTKTRNLVLQQAWRELQGWRKKYADLQEFSSLVEVIDELAEKKKAS